MVDQLGSAMAWLNLMEPTCLALAPADSKGRGDNNSLAKPLEQGGCQDATDGRSWSTLQTPSICRASLQQVGVPEDHLFSKAQISHYGKGCGCMCRS